MIYLLMTLKLDLISLVYLHKLLKIIYLYQIKSLR
nr:MAG TPA: hypothetical protein [Caudoviricetes sp.]